MKLGIVFLCVALGWIQATWNSRAASAFDLREFLPYQRASSSSLISTTGTGFEFDFYSPMRDNEFYWRFRKGTMQRRTNFRSMQLRTDAAGLSVFADFFTIRSCTEIRFPPPGSLFPLWSPKGRSSPPPHR